MRKICFVFLFSHLCLATPDKVEVWFLSAPKLAFLQQLLPANFITSPMLAANDNCVPMGDGCFHPQLGYIGEDKAPKEISDNSYKEEVDLIECEDERYFNLYCKNYKNKQRFAKIEVWLDNSSSLRNIDSPDSSGMCKRQVFVDNLRQKCGRDRVAFQVYNTSIKELGDSGAICQHYGLNNSKKLIKWIEASSVKKLYIITDVDEYSTELGAFLESIGATVKGIGVEALTVEELVSNQEIVGSACH